MAAHTKRYRRTTDRIEDVAAWVLLAAGMVLIAVSCTVGLGIGGRTADRARIDAPDRAPGVARALSASPTPSGEGAARSRTAGRTVLIRFGRTVSAAPASTPPREALVGSLTATALVLGLGAFVLIGLWVVVRRATFAYNCAQWEREWRAVAPIWGKG